jgi:hypothetical protein
MIEDDTGSRNEEETELIRIFKVAELSNQVLLMSGGVKEVKDDFQVSSLAKWEHSGSVNPRNEYKR